MKRLLIVDDEPNLVAGLADYLSAACPAETDVLKAYSGQEALALLTRFPIDLIVSDIQMSGMSGLDLLEHIERWHPTCCVIFLTGHANFDWVQVALRHPCCVDYILKTQGDDVISAAVLKQLRLLEEGRSPEVLKKMILAQQQALQPFVRQQEFVRWMAGTVDNLSCMQDSSGESRYIVGMFSRSHPGYLGDRFLLVLESLMQKELAGTELLVALIGWQEYGWIGKFAGSSLEPLQSMLHARLETIQGRLREMNEDVNCVYYGAPLSLKEARAHFQPMRDLLMASNDSDGKIMMDVSRCPNPSIQRENEIVAWIKQYIADHIADPNLSLTIIAEKTYYTPSYLSRMFKASEGINLHSYIAQVRLDTACKLLRQGRKNVKEISRLVGFESPSYFSSFFRRNIGVTPVQYMRDTNRM